MKQVMINGKGIEAKGGSETLLGGRWLLVARLFWGILALAIVVLNVLAVPAGLSEEQVFPVNSFFFFCLSRQVTKTTLQQPWSGYMETLDKLPRYGLYLPYKLVSVN